MDRNYIDNRHVVARYLADQLSESELLAFEDYLVSHPEIVRDVEATARLKVGLHKLGSNNELVTLLKPTSWLRDRRYLALAASMAVIALGATLWLARGTFETPRFAASVSALANQAGKPLPIASSHAILRTRGIAFDAEIELPATPQAIELRVLPEVEAHPARYRITIAKMGDGDALSVIDALGGLTPDDTGFVGLYFDSSKLTSGRYQLIIGGDANTDAANSVSAFRIKIVSPN